MGIFSTIYISDNRTIHIVKPIYGFYDRDLSVNGKDEFVYTLLKFFLALLTLKGKTLKTYANIKGPSSEHNSLCLTERDNCTLSNKVSSFTKQVAWLFC